VDHGYGYTSPTYQDRYALCAGVCARELGAGLYARARVHGKHEHTVRVVTLKKKTHCSVVIFEKRADAVFYGATLLTAITDNAALTYLASLVPGLSDEFKVAVVAGAVTGGGLTVIANAPNPAGVAILKGKFDEGVVSAGKLLLAAIPPTIVAAMAFRLL
jgi:predicted cation transporter